MRRKVVRFDDPRLRREEDSKEGPDGEERLLPGKEDKKARKTISSYRNISELPENPMDDPRRVS